MDVEGVISTNYRCSTDKKAVKKLSRILVASHREGIARSWMLLADRFQNLAAGFEVDGFPKIQFTQCRDIVPHIQSIAKASASGGSITSPSITLPELINLCFQASEFKSSTTKMPWMQDRTAAGQHLSDIGPQDCEIMRGLTLSIRAYRIIENSREEMELKVSYLRAVLLDLDRMRENDPNRWDTSVGPVYAEALDILFVSMGWDRSSIIKCEVLMSLHDFMRIFVLVTAIEKVRSYEHPAKVLSSEFIEMRDRHWNPKGHGTKRCHRFYEFIQRIVKYIYFQNENQRDAGYGEVMGTAFPLLSHLWTIFRVQYPYERLKDGSLAIVLTLLNLRPFTQLLGGLMENERIANTSYPDFLDVLEHGILPEIELNQGEKYDDKSDDFFDEHLIAELNNAKSNSLTSSTSLQSCDVQPMSKNEINRNESLAAIKRSGHSFGALHHQDQVGPAHEHSWIPKAAVQPYLECVKGYLQLVRATRRDRGQNMFRMMFIVKQDDSPHQKRMVKNAEVNANHRNLTVVKASRPAKQIAEKDWRTSLRRKTAMRKSRMISLAPRDPSLF